MDLTPAIYGGVDGYGSLTGTQGGLFVLGLGGGVHKEFFHHWWIDAGLDLDVPCNFYYVSSFSNVLPKNIKFLDFQRNDFGVILQGYRQKSGTLNTNGQVQDGTIALVGAEPLQTLQPVVDGRQGIELVGKQAGFSLHAGVSTKAYERAKLERLCRYISRPPVSAHRLSLTPEGNIRYTLKTPYRNGTTAVIFEPLDFIGKLAALIPSPRVNLTRFYGVFAPNSRYRPGIVKQSRINLPADTEVKTEGEKKAAMRWAGRLKRSFGIDIKTCEACGGRVKVIACIDEPDAIKKILTFVQAEQSNQAMLPVNRAPPAGLLLRKFI